MWKEIQPDLRYDDRHPWDRGWKIPIVPWRAMPHPDSGIAGIAKMLKETIPDEEYLQTSRKFHERHRLVRQYAWTITSPATLDFIHEYAGNHIHDPLAGTGYWAYLLRQYGHKVTASDIAPGNNPWAEDSHYSMESIDARASAYQAGPRATLLLAWPPYQSPIGHQILRAFRGDRIIYIGEGAGGCCGDDQMFRELDRAWREVAWHRPAQWEGIYDYVTAYRRVKRFGQ